MADLSFYYGTMDSGKSTKLLQRAYNLTKKGNKVAIFKPAVDTKGENRIVSRLGISREISDFITPEMNLYHLTKEKY